MISHPSRSSHRRSACKLLVGVCLLMLALAMAVVPAALGRATGAHHSTCKSSTHARHASRSARCVRHQKTASKHTKGGVHKTTGKPVSHKTATRVPLRCEDGTLPVQEAPGEFACDDESTPSCPDGSEAQLSPDGTTLTCVAVTGSEAKQEGSQTEVCEVSGEEEAASCALAEEES